MSDREDEALVERCQACDAITNADHIERRLSEAMAKSLALQARIDALRSQPAAVEAPRPEEVPEPAPSGAVFKALAPPGGGETGGTISGRYVTSGAHERDVEKAVDAARIVHPGVSRDALRCAVAAYVAGSLRVLPSPSPPPSPAAEPSGPTAEAPDAWDHRRMAAVLAEQIRNHATAGDRYWQARLVNIFDEIARRAVEIFAERLVSEEALAIARDVLGAGLEDHAPDIDRLAHKIDAFARSRVDAFAERLVSDEAVQAAGEAADRAILDKAHPEDFRRAARAAIEAAIATAKKGTAP